jgi:peptidyl-prolyl cis-trans isomerase SurA
MVTRAGDDAVVRHILIVPSVTKTEIEKQNKDWIVYVQEIIAGNTNFNEAVSRYSEDDIH